MYLSLRNSFFQSFTAALCLAGMQLVMFRAATGAVETITAGTIDLTTVIRLRGPIVAFHGLSRGPNDGACIARLGGHRLLHSSELPSKSLGWVFQYMKPPIMDSPK